MIDVAIRAYAELNDFLPPSRRQGVFTRRIKFPTSVKDLLEGIGIPHTEIAVVLIDQEPAGFDRLIDRQCRVTAYPAFRTVRIQDGPAVQSADAAPLRFVADVHLGRLARYLRLLGFDTRYERDAGDNWLVSVAADDRRILLTRDRELLMRAAVDRGYFVRSDDPLQQVLNVARRFDLSAAINPFSRCLTCNGLLRPVEKADIEARLEPNTRRYFNRFWECQSCGNLYWEGSHYQRLRELVMMIAPDAPDC